MGRIEMTLGQACNLYTTIDMMTELASFLNRLLSWNAGQILSFGLVVVVIYIGSVAAFTLGILLILPPVVASSANSATLLHITGQVTLLATLAAVLYRISQLLVRGFAFFGVFLLCKYHYGRIHKRRLDSPSVSRLQQRLNNAIAEQRVLRRTQVIARLLLVFSAIFPIFFSFETGSIIVSWRGAFIALSLPPLGLIAVAGTLVAYRVGSQRTYIDFFQSTEGRQLLTAAAFFLLMFLGSLRALSMMYGPAFNYIGVVGECRLAPVVPIQGGSLYFDKASSNFLVLDGGKPVFLVPGVGSQGLPECFAN